MNLRAALAKDAGDIDAMNTAGIDPATLHDVGTFADAAVRISSLMTDFAYREFTVLDILYTDAKPQAWVILESAAPDDPAWFGNVHPALRQELCEAVLALSSPLRWRSPESVRAEPIEASPLLFRECAKPIPEGAGICFPVHSGINRAGAVIFLGEGKPDLTMDEICALRLFCLSWFAKLSRLSVDRRARERVTGRELECLQMAANGLTSEAIAVALGLSKHTINHHLISAAIKLDAVNRTHAIAKGVRMGLIR